MPAVLLSSWCQLSYFSISKFTHAGKQASVSMRLPLVFLVTRSCARWVYQTWFTTTSFSSSREQLVNACDRPGAVFASLISSVIGVFMKSEHILKVVRVPRTERSRRALNGSLLSCGISSSTQPRAHPSKFICHWAFLKAHRWMQHRPLNISSGLMRKVKV